MAAVFKVFSASSGLNVNVDPARLPYDPETGVQDLAVAYNVDHDRTGRVSRRKGYSATSVTDDCHSLWSNGTEAFFVTGTSLRQLHSDYSCTTVATVTSGARASYASIAGRVYWMNGHEKGYVENGVNNTWAKGTYYGPETNRQLSDPPTGHIVAAYNGRVWVARGNTLWYSDPFDLNAFDLARNFFWFASTIRMVRPVSTGIFVGDGNRVWFLLGSTAKEMSILPKTLDPPILGTDAEVDLAEFGSGDFNGIGAIWTTTKGVCLGTPDGIVMNLTQRKVDLPISREGAAAVMNRKYIVLLEP